MGNGLATESSKSILQTTGSYTTLIPQFIARPYALQDQVNSGEVDHLYIINIQFTHPLQQNLHPVIAIGRLSLETPSENIRYTFKPWFMKYAIFELGMELELNGQAKHACIPFEDTKDELEFYIEPLTSIENNDDIYRMVEKLFVQNLTAST